MTDKYFFTIGARVDSKAVGEIPGGFRVDIGYREGGSVTTKATPYCTEWLGGNARSLILAALDDTQAAWYASDEDHCVALEAAAATLVASGKTTSGSAMIDANVCVGLQTARRGGADPSTVPVLNALRALQNARGIEWFGVSGSLLGGSDWAVIREDGVAQFNGRLTVKTDDGFLIGVTVGGVADLRLGAGAPRRSMLDSGKSLFDEWRKGVGANQFKAVFAVAFDAAGASQSWAGTAYDYAASFWKYQRLTRGQFLANVTLDVDDGAFSPLKEVTMDIVEVTP